MSHERIFIEREKDLAIISINNPPANTLNKHILKDLSSIFLDFERPGYPKVIILTGKGDIFSAGAELSELAKAGTANEAEKIIIGAKSLLDKIEQYRKPVIAAINGLCLGGGLELALACHIRIADENSKFGFPEIKLGLMPGAGGTQRFTRTVGFSKACEIILTGEFIDAREARQLGLISSLTPAGKSIETALRLGEKISGMGQMAVISALAAIRSSLYSNASEGMKTETILFGKLFETEDARKGITAFMEKRKF